MHTPKLPHPLCEVRIEVTVENRVAHRAVPVARSAIGDLVGESLARPDTLTVQVSRIGSAFLREPLMGMQVEHVRFLRPRVQIPEFHAIAQVTMVHVGWIVRVCCQ